MVTLTVCLHNTVLSEKEYTKCVQKVNVKDQNFALKKYNSENNRKGSSDILREIYIIGDIIYV